MPMVTASLAKGVWRSCPPGRVGRFAADQREGVVDLLNRVANLPLLV